jgi:hypothetical protein
MYSATPQFARAVSELWCYANGRVGLPLIQHGHPDAANHVLHWQAEHVVVCIKIRTPQFRGALQFLGLGLRQQSPEGQSRRY